MYFIMGVILLIILAVEVFTLSNSSFDEEVEKQEQQEDLVNDFKNSEFTQEIYNKISKNSEKGQLWSIVINGGSVDYFIATGYSIGHRVSYDSYSIVFRELGYENLDDFNEQHAFCDALVNKLGGDFYSDYSDNDYGSNHYHIEYRYQKEYIQYHEDIIKSQSTLKKTH